jgi:ACT domain-containing protein
MSDLTEAEIRKIAEQVVQQLGSHATPANVEKVVHETIQRIEQHEPAAMVSPSAVRSIENSSNRDRVIVTAFGKNKIGILGGITSTLATTNCDVIDLSQKILKEFFTIMLLIDISNSSLDFESIKQELINTGEKFDLKVVVQHEEIFKTMHRI